MKLLLALAGALIALHPVAHAAEGVNIATDAVVQKLGVSEKTADLLMKAPSFAADLMKPPSQPYESGGIRYNFDK